MGVIFKLDGTKEKFEDKFDLQEELKDRLKNYDESIFDYFGSLRTYRDIELKESDWTQGDDVPDTIKLPYQTYRKALREIGDAATTADVVWPTKPS